MVAGAEARRLSSLTWAARAKPDEASFGVDAGGKRDDPVHDVFGISSRDWQRFYHFTVGGPVEDVRLTTLPAYE